MTLVLKNGPQRWWKVRKIGGASIYSTVQECWWCYKSVLFVCLFVCNRGDSFMSQDGLRTRKLCQSPMPDHCCNSGIIRGASPRCFPYTITRLLLKSQHVMRDTALELGPPSGTGKLIPLLLDAGTSSCTRLPPPTDGIFPHLAHSHTCFTAQV